MNKTRGPVMKRIVIVVLTLTIISTIIRFLFQTHAASLAVNIISPDFRSSSVAGRRARRGGLYTDYLKRAFDIAVSGTLLLLASPILLATYIAVRATSPGPAFFTQIRAGYQGRPFKIYKFRSMDMTTKVDPNQQVYLDDPRITRVGHFIRRYKIDELPQLWNILRGDMSLIGPRPTLPEHVAMYKPGQFRRLSVTPGLTGWAQVHGNIMLPIDERIAHDLWYVDNRSFWVDLKILFMTASVVLFGEKVKDAGLTHDELAELREAAA